MSFRGPSRLVPLVAALAFLCVGAAQLVAAPASTTRPTPPPLELRLLNTLTHTYHPREVHRLIANPRTMELYTVGDETVINAWEAIVFCWPEFAGLFALFLALALIRPLRRAIRHHRLAGELYCRRCFYQLRGVDSANCPECGVHLTPRRKVTGRPRRLRITLLVLAFISLMSLYPPLLLTHPPRRPPLAQRFEWYSSALHHFAHERKIPWLIALDRNVRRINRLDHRAAPPRATLLLRTLATGNFWPMISDDGQQFCLVRDDQVLTFSTADGSPLKQYRTSGGLPLWFPFFSSDGQIIYAIDNRQTLQRWDAATTQLLPPVTFPPSVRSRPWRAVTRASDGSVILVFADRQVVVVHPDGAAERLFTFQDGAVFEARTHARTPASADLYLTWKDDRTGLHGDNIQLWNPLETRPRQIFTRPTPPRFIALTPDGKTLLSCGLDDDWRLHIEALDPLTGQLITDLRLPRDLIIPNDIILSPDGSRLAILSNTTATPTSAKAHILELRKHTPPQPLTPNP